LRVDVAQAAWRRAALLGDGQTADELVPTLKSLLPEASVFLDDYRSGREPETKRFSAIYCWLHFPGLEPVVDSGTGRRVPLNEQDAYRDNWWCGAALPTAGTSEEEQKRESAPPFDILRGRKFPDFVTQPQRTATQKELAALKSLGSAPNYLCLQVVQWATSHPDDIRIPEALHLAVKATRYGCTDKETGKWSKAAYDLLHKRYPDNSWTKRTPYWFKD